ncbi:mitochondrial import protein Pam17-domain-containing protein [Lentinula raphanica]|nr:mitochondrial import protein Pam17-domain-containing protein [Lentinula raphanica]
MQRTLFIQSFRSFNCHTIPNVSIRVVFKTQTASQQSPFTLAKAGLVRFKSTKNVAQKTTPTPTLTATSSATASEKAKTAASQTSTPKINGETLTWPEYLNIRRSKRRWQNFAAVPCSLVGLLCGAAYFGGLETDPMKPILGLDPFMLYGICTTACMGVGYLVGPTLGAFLWRQLPSSRRYGNLIDKKDKEFYERIAKNRVDVTLQSPTSPVPDYYGEKVGSLREYRKWLRDQNKYRRKVSFDEAA